MQCPHCTTTIHEGWRHISDLGADADHTNFGLYFMGCPECNRLILKMQTDYTVINRNDGLSTTTRDTILYPRVAVRPPPPSEVPDPFAQDYREACLVLDDSPKASAALSRRCLQAVLREKAAVKPSDLSREIDAAMPGLPPYLADAIDAVRNVGNFAAHPVKSRSTGEVVDVEAGEAEWLLDVLEGLFGFYFVEPAALKEKRDVLNAKLHDVGKPPLKSSASAEQP